MKLCCTLISMLCCTLVLAQVPVGPSYNQRVIDFQHGYPSSHFQGYTGLGFSNSSLSGALNSHAWCVIGLSDGNSDFGEEHISDDFARGLSSGNVNTGGIYAFDRNGERYLGWQATSTDLSPGKLRLKIQNQDSVDCLLEAISFDLIINNNEDRSSALSLSYRNYSTSQQLSYQSIISTDSADTLGWQKLHFSIPFPMVLLKKDSTMEIDFEISDYDGTGSRDEWGINNIQFQSRGILFQQGFEGSAVDNWNLTYGAESISSNQGAVDYPSFQRIMNGTFSWQAIPMQKDSLALAKLNVANYEELTLVINLSATGNGGGGLDASDSCHLFLNGKKHLSIQGNNDNSWSFHPNAPAVKALHIKPFPTELEVLQCPGGGLRDAFNDALSSFQIPLLDNIDSLQVSVVCNSDQSNEHWNVDDVLLTGQSCHCNSAQITNIQHYNQGDSLVLRVQKGLSDSVLILLSEAPITLLPKCNYAYTANANLDLAPFLDLDSSISIIAIGNDSLYTISNLENGKKYYLKAIAFETLNCYNKEAFYYDFVHCGGSGLGERVDFASNLLPLNWANSKTNTWYTSNSNSGVGIPAFKFDTDLQTLESSEQCERIGLISFWFKGISNDSISSFVVEGRDETGTWLKLDSSVLYTQSSNDYSRYLVSINPDLNIRKVRWLYKKSEGNMALDDISLFTTGPSGVFQWVGSMDMDFQNPYNWIPPRFAPSTMDSLIISGNASSQLSTDAVISKLSFLENAKLHLESQNRSTIIFHSTESVSIFANADNLLSIGGAQPLQLIFSSSDSVILSLELSLEGSLAHQLYLQNTGLRFSSNGNFKHRATNTNHGIAFPFIRSGSNSHLTFSANSGYHLMSQTAPFPTELPWISFESGSSIHHSTSSDFSLDGSWFPNIISRGDKQLQIAADSEIDGLVIDEGMLTLSGGYDLRIRGDLLINDSAQLRFDSIQSGSLLLTADSGLISANSELNCTWPTEISGSYTLDGAAIFSDVLRISGSLALSAEDSLYAQDSLVVSGNLSLSNGASLLQDEVLLNTGNCQYRQSISTASQFGQYHFWSSPTQDTTAQIGAGTGLYGSNLYRYDPFPAPVGSYLAINAPTSMLPGRGYVLSHCGEAVFNGTFNNGAIEVPITSDASIAPYHLLGNPYPSPINAASFLEANSTILNGTIYLWSQDGNYSQDASKHYVAINQAGSSAVTQRAQTSLSTQLAVGQGFFVELQENLASGDYNILFNNQMRNGSRADLKSQGNNDVEKYWIYVVNDLEDSLSCLFLINQQCSPKFDIGYDAYAMEGGKLSMEYGKQKYQILAISDMHGMSPIPIHINHLNQGSYRIGIMSNSQSKKPLSPILIDTKNSDTRECNEGNIQFSISGNNSQDNRFFIGYKRTNSPTQIDPITSRIDGLKKASYYVVSDLQGRIIMKTKQALSEIISSPKLSPSVYILNAYDDENMLLSRQKFVLK